MHLRMLHSLLLLTAIYAAVPTPAPTPDEPQLANNLPVVISKTSRASYVNFEILLRRTVEECARRQDTVIQLDKDGKLEVLPSLSPDAPCALIDIPLRGTERGVGMCTDVALYVLHTKARIIPLLSNEQMQQYSAKCSNSTARMLLESMYREWLSPSHQSLHLMQVNSEHMFKTHEDLHTQIDLFLCKTRFCHALLKQYIAKHKLKGRVWFVGHTSSDVLVDPPEAQGHPQGADSTTPHTPTNNHSSLLGMLSGMATSLAQPGTSAAIQRKAIRIRADYAQFLHVKGKSGLKHTKQLLECWAKHPEFPKLTVIGSLTAANAYVSAALQAPNVVLLPKPKSDKQHSPADTAALTTAQRLVIAAAAAGKAAKEAEATAAQKATAAAVAEQDAESAQAAANRAAATQDEQQKASTKTAAEVATARAVVARQKAAEAAATARNAAEQAAAAAAEAGMADAVELSDAAVPDQADQLPRRTVLTKSDAAVDASATAAKLRAGGKVQLQTQSNASVSGDKHQQEELVSFDGIRALQANIGIHICPSEREGFGHYINEARAAGAMIISTDHPPMNELVTNDSGVLIRTERTASYNEWMALGEFGNINAFLGPDDICAAVQSVLQMPMNERVLKGRAARRLYLHDKSQFVHKVKRLQQFVMRWREKGFVHAQSNN